jgi:Domain of unknown function (DUF1848)
MIISASYKTDIPTFYGEWFIRRLQAGYCKMVNPYNRQVIRVSLAREDVDGFVFWTKNVSPFLKHLGEVHSRDYPFIIQHTINGYPRELEKAVVNADRSVKHLKRIAETYGAAVCVWRYDTIVISSLTPVDFHLRRFESLAKALEGVTDEVVVSFVHLYTKTLRNMEDAAHEHGFTWTDPLLDEKRSLAKKLVEIASGHGIQLTICSQREYLVEGAGDARCVDAVRLERVGGQRIRASLRGNRKECGCFASHDIGEYDTCPHGCVYCYAVRNHELAQRRFKQHKPDSDFLFEPEFPVTEKPAGDAADQLGLFEAKPKKA